MKYKWIFVVITLIVVSLFLIQKNMITLLLLIYWIIRIVIVKHKQLWLIISCISVLFLVRIWIIPSESAIVEPIETAIVLVRPTTYQIDGDQLKFEGYLPDYDEEIVAQYTIQTKDEKKSLEYLNSPAFLIHGELRVPKDNSNINQFNYKKYLKRKGIFYQYRAEKLLAIESDIPIPYSIRFDHLRYQMIKKIDQIFDGTVEKYIQALIFANVDAMDVTVIDLYRSLGIIHLISISGLHIDLLIRIVKGILRLLKISREKSNIAIIITLPMYLFIAGIGVSVFRAVISNMIQPLSKLLRFDVSKSDCWSITMIIALLINPAIIFSIGFQLSYGLSGLLIMVSENKLLESYRPFQQLIMINLLVNIVSIPIITYHFFEYPLAAFIINLIYVPIFSGLLFPLVVLTLIVGLIFQRQTVTVFFTMISNFILNISEILLESIATFRLFNFIPGRLSIMSYVGILISIIIILVTINKQKSKWLFCGCAMYFIFITSNHFSPLGFVYMFDVGQGDAIMLKAPFSNEATLIDTGGQFSWEEKENWQIREKHYSLSANEIVPTLKSLGVSQINQLYLTHGDFDHVGELSELQTLIPIKEIISTQTAFESEILQPVIKNTNSLISVAKIPSVEQIRNQQFAILHPISVVEDSNNSSLVIHTNLGGINWLFTGDLEESGEKSLMRQYPDMTVDVLKVGHHGSDTSSTESFINYYRPNVALISAGENNRYNHPHNDVIERLEHYELLIYRTDEQGGILYQYSEIEFLNQLFNQFITVK